MAGCHEPACSKPQIRSQARVGRNTEDIDIMSNHKPHERRVTALGPQGLAIIPPAGSRAQDIARAALRAKIEEASIRPPAGTSEMLARSMSVEETVSVGHRGRVVTLYDLTDLAPVHLIGSRIGQRKERK
jgi:hypothetical protein